jgi:anti-sigma factor RsiW
MTPSERTRLIHAVLDGEATDAEARELDRLLAADPHARAEYDGVKRVFDALASVPQPHAPEGLVASVLARLPARPVPKPPVRQLSSELRVSNPSGGDADSINLHRPGARGYHPRGHSMSDRNGNPTDKRRIWMVGGLAAVAAAIAVGYAVDFPSSGDKAVGTIVPAERYRAPQMKAEDVKLGAPGSAGTASTSPAAAAASSAASNQATTDAAKTQATMDSVKQRAAMDAANTNRATVDAKINATTNAAVNAKLDAAASKATMEAAKK